MTGKKITARKARQVCNARKARHNSRKAREALKAHEDLQNWVEIPPRTVKPFRRYSFEELMRDSWRREAQTFLSNQKHSGDVRKTLIGTSRPYSWTEADKTGFTWVAMYGLGFMTVVFKKDENAVCRGGYVDPESFYRGFSSAVVDEMKDIADGIIRPKKKLPPGIPFAVVCETTSTTNVQEASNAAPDPPAFVKFIRNEMRNGFPLDKSSKYIEIAISVLQLVHEQKFQADDIGVWLWCVKSLGSLSRDSISKYLAVINHPDSGGCNKKHLVVNEADSGACSKEENSHDINGGFIKKHLAVNESDSGGCSKEHVAVNEPDSRARAKEEAYKKEYSILLEAIQASIKKHFAGSEPDKGGSQACP